jgi:predicted RNA-binding Zn ribbon-like protein
MSVTANLPPAIFIADATGLDFLNSIATPDEVPVDWIADGEGYLRWLDQAGLAPIDVLRDARTRAQPSELDQLAREARCLREWFREFVHQHKGHALTGAALAELEPLNYLLEKSCSFSQIALRPDRRKPFMIQSVRRWQDAEALLLPVAEALARLVSTEDFALVKACEGPACTLLFADHTRGHARRWCSMAICGNRAKQAAHRHRRKMQLH